MRTVTATLKSLSSYSQSKMLPAKPPKETWEDYEERIWREKCHVNDDGFIFIPPMSFKFALDAAARYMRIQIPGKGKSEYTKHFLSGIIVPEGPVLPDRPETVDHIWILAHANGKRGSGSRVPRCFPMIHKWTAQVTYYVLDETITKEVFERVLRESGNFIGIGRFNPEHGGFNGRYEVVDLKWSE